MEVNLRDISRHWLALHKALGLGAPIATESEYEQALQSVQALMDDTPTLDDGPLGTLVSLLADRIRDYEARRYPWPDSSSAADVLRFMMSQHGLVQADLAEVGSQGVVSEILSGKRELNLRQANLLARRFGVSMDVFARV